MYAVFVTVALASLLEMALVGSCTPVPALHSVPYNFTLATVNMTLPNANSTGAPLVLGQNGVTEGMSFEVTSTYFSYPYNDYPALALVDGNLRAFNKYGEWITNASAPSTGSQLEWITSRSYTSPAAPAFSAVHAPSSEQLVLAVYGIADLWHLCPPDGGEARTARGQTNVVFNRSVVEEEGPEFNPTLCYPVLINILPVS